MTNKFILIIISFFCIHTCSAQVPEATIITMEGFHGNNSEYLVPEAVRTSDNGFIVSLTTSSQVSDVHTICSGDSAYVYVKYNKDGFSVDWAKCNNNYWFIEEMSDGGYVYGANGSTELYIKRQNSLGQTLWEKSYGGSGADNLYDIVATEDTGCIILVTTNSSDGDVGFHYGSVFQFDLWVAKINSSGNIVWDTVLGGSGDEMPGNIIPAPDNGVYVLARTTSTDFDCASSHGGNTDVFVARIDKDGNKLWAKCYGGSGDEAIKRFPASARGVSYTDGSVLIAASTSSNDGDISTHIGGHDFWLFNVDTNGDLLWDKCYGGKLTDQYANTLCVASDGSFWIGGTTNNPTGEVEDGQVVTHNGNYDGWLVHAAPNREFLSAVVFGSLDVDEVTVLHPLDNGIVMVGGMYRELGHNLPNKFLGTRNIFLARVAPWTTNIAELKNKDMDLIAYPNPTNTTMHIAFAHQGEIKKVKVHSADGKLMYKNTTYPIEGIDVSRWASGIYYIEVHTKHKTSIATATVQ